MSIAQTHGLAVDPRTLKHEFGADSFTTRTVLLAARKISLKQSSQTGHRRSKRGDVRYPPPTSNLTDPE